MGIMKLFQIDLVKSIKNSAFVKAFKSGFGLLDTAGGGPPGATKVGLLSKVYAIFKPLLTMSSIVGKLAIVGTISTFFGKTGGFLKSLGKTVIIII